MKSTIHALAIALLYGTARADEGMWMPQQLPQIGRQLQAAGLRLNPAALTRLTDFPMGAIVGLGGCSASFVSPLGLVVTNHHCVYASLAQNSTPQRNLLTGGFLAPALADELPAVPGSRIFVTRDVRQVSDNVITAAVDKLTGKARSDAIESNQKALVAACETDPGHRCNVAAFYGGLEFYLIKRLEIRDVRLVHAPPEGVGNFGGDTDNWMWPRHTGDYGFYRAYVGPDGKAADFSPQNIPYRPAHFLKLAREGVAAGDFVMALGYPGFTNRHRLPSEVAYAFGWNYPAANALAEENLAIIALLTKDDPDTALKYASQVAGINNAYKYRQGVLASYADSDLLARKTREHAQLKAWVGREAARRARYGDAIAQVEQLVLQRDAEARRDFFLNAAVPRLLRTARTLYRLAQESGKPDAARKPGYQERDRARIAEGLSALERNYDDKVDRALALNGLIKYAAQPAAQRRAGFDAALGIRDGATPAELAALLDALYAGSRLREADQRLAWLERRPEQFQASGDSFIKAAIALYDNDLRREAQQEELGGNLQLAYGGYMRAKIAYLQSLGQAVYPDANNTLRLTFGHVAGRARGADGTSWLPFTTLAGVLAKATGSGEFNAPAAQLAAIRARDFGPYLEPRLKTVPVDFLATLDITGGNSGSAVLNARGELVGLAFDGTLDSIISDWDYNPANTRSIQVDLRYMLWNMQKVDKAERLLREMGVPQ
jgi:hypothetical protein